ncbi:MAG: glycosyltransferase family 2 protein [Gammaproteobacteria bacterium]|nr:glycosyltransferase family 2 protein [Gammaproteobacteria bacterium]
MKLIVQIPCFNEEHTLPLTVADIPREIPGIACVEILIIDDGSTDRTVEVARELGVHHIVQNKRNLGLAHSFRRGLQACLAAGADIIVNTDGDNQYAGYDIPKLVAPVVEGRADIVVGDRQTSSIAHFSTLKKLLQVLGSTAVRFLSGLSVPDAVSGFRAISREAALRLNIVSSFSYTIEMLIQAGRRQMTVLSVPVGTNAKTRESRLFKSIPNFVRRSLATMMRIYAMYRPMRVFFVIGLAITLVGVAPILRFIINYMANGGAGHIQSLVLGGVLVIMGFIVFMIGLLADLISFNRQLIEMTLETVRRQDLYFRSIGIDTSDSGRGEAGRERVLRALDEATAVPLRAADGSQVPTGVGLSASDAGAAVLTGSVPCATIPAAQDATESSRERPAATLTGGGRLAGGSR